MLPAPPAPQDRFRADCLNSRPQPSDPACMPQDLHNPADQTLPATPDASPDTGTGAVSEAEAKPDTLASLAVDANALARAIWSGRGDDVSRLVADLLKGRDAA